MGLYYTRTTSMTQATTTLATVQTGADGSTAGPIRVPGGVSHIKSIRASCTLDGAWTTITGYICVLRISGNGVRNGPHDLVLMSGHHEDGGGVLTYTTEIIIKPMNIPVDIPIVSGNDIKLEAAYYGADPGSPQLCVTLELD